MAMDAVRHREPFDLSQVLRAAEHDLRGHRALMQDQLAAINIIEEEIQGHQPLLEAGLEALPGLGSDDPRDDVERKDLLVALGVRIYGERDAVVAEHLHGELVAALELVRAEAVQLLEEPAIAPPWVARGRKQFGAEGVALRGGPARFC